jgi:hypothetical protein
MAYQYVHVQTFSIKSGGAGIAAEAERKESHSRHVAAPKPPVLVAGVEPIEAWNAVVERHGKSCDLYTKKSGIKGERKLRSDAHILVGAVASHPEPTATCDIESPDFKDWLNRSIAFFTEEHGEPLSVVIHLDESHPHIHFLTAPDLERGQRMPDIHCGEKAKEKVGGKHAKKHIKDQAWKEAMRGYQDRYQESVGVYHGLARLGPQGRRLPAGAYQAEQAEAKRQAATFRELEQWQLATLDERQTLETEKATVAGAGAEVAAARIDLEARERTVTETQAKIEATKIELETRETAVEAAQIGVVQVKAELSEREQTVAQTQARVAEAQSDLEARETVVTAAQREVRKAQKTLNVKTEKFRNAKAELNERVVHVSQREQRLAGVWGAFVSAVTLGKAGTKRRVETAVEAVKADFAGKLTESMADLEKAEQAHEKATQRLESENRSLEEQNMTLTGAVSAAEKAERGAHAKAQELADRLKPMEATNAELKAARDNLAALVDDLDAAASAGDLVLVQDLLNPDGVGPGLRV